MRLKNIAGHTIDLDLLTPGGFVLDAGCRNFHFATELTKRNCIVVAIDADPTVENPGFGGVFLNVAIADKAGEQDFLMHANPEARHLVGPGVASFPKTKVNVITIADLMKFYRIGHWDVVKLDVEGAEYEILKNWPGPVASQISIEFHEHTMPQPQSVYDSIFEHLGKWYQVVRHIKEARHCTHPSFWDSLLTLKEPHES